MKFLPRHRVKRELLWLQNYTGRTVSPMEKIPARLTPLKDYEEGRLTQYGCPLFSSRVKWQIMILPDTVTRIKWLVPSFDREHTS